MNTREPNTITSPIEITQAMVRAGLSSDQADLAGKLSHRTIDLTPRRGFGRLHFSPDEAIYVRAGLLAKYKTSPAGRRKIVSLSFPGECLFPPYSNVGAAFEAIVRTELLLINKDDFTEALVEIPEFASVCLRGMQRQAAISEEWLLNCGSRDTETRVAHLLCEIAVRSGLVGNERTFLNPFTQAQMAEITGQTSVNVNRVLSELDRSQLIVRNKRQVSILDWRQFTRFADFNPEYLE